MPHTYAYPRPALTVDCVVFGVDEESLKVLLIRRGAQPFKGRWALPGGFVDMDETLEQAARRELEEETGVRVRRVEQLAAFDDPKRDPRGRTITVAFVAVVNRTEHRLAASDDAAEVAWFSLSRLPRLAFDHRKILAQAHEHICERVRTEPLVFELLPRKFTLTQLQRLYELILERPLDKRNFRKKVLSLGALEPLSEVERGVAHRAARLYRFDPRSARELRKEGVRFEV